MSDHSVLAFLSYEVDQTAQELRHNGTPVPIEPQVFDLIACFAGNAGKVLSRDDLIEAVWAGRIVSDSSISTRINAARQALGDDGARQQVIRTVPRKGFRFEPEVTHGNPASGMDPGPSPDKPSVAVLPFQNMSGDPDQTHFSDGITDDIITELARYRDIFVIARQSSFAYRGTAATPARIAQELGVQYILEGSVRRSGQRIRVSAQLIDPLSGAHLWVERYDRDIEDIFEVQDEITAMIANTLTGEISRESYKRSLAKSSDKVNAYDHYLRASEINWRAGRDDVRVARAEAEKAIEADPGFSRAHALVAWTCVAEFLNAWRERPRDALDEAMRYATAAITADPREPFGYAVLGWVYMCERDFERGLAEQRRAIADNPGSAHYRSLYAFTLAYAGQSEKAIEELEKAMLLNPRYPDLYRAHYGRALFNLRRYDEAIEQLERLRTTQPGNTNAIAAAAACYAALGRLDEARATVAEVQAASPAYTLDHARTNVPYARQDERDHFIENLTLAGLT